MKTNSITFLLLAAASRFCAASQNAERKADSSSTPPSTPSATGGAPLPSPTGWMPMGCIIDLDSQWLSALETRVMVDDAMTIPKCQDACIQSGWGVAGVKKGNECWCGGGFFDSGEGDPVCDVPCAGDKATICGGEEAMNIWFSLFSDQEMASFTVGGFTSVTNIVKPTKSASIDAQPTNSASIHADHTTSAAIQSKTSESVASGQARPNSSAPVSAEPPKSAARRNRPFFFFSFF